MFYHPRRSTHVDDLLGGRRFPYPKDHDVLARWIAMWMPTDGIIVDFFAGSGSTLEAVLRLNAADGGTRRGILITNNEVATADRKWLTAAGHRPGDPAWEACGVYEHVTRHRIEAVLTGRRPDGTIHGDPVSGHVEFTYRPSTARLAAVA